MRDGFAHGGWAMPRHDKVMGATFERHLARIAAERQGVEPPGLGTATRTEVNDARAVHR